MDALHERALKAIEEVYGDRLKRWVLEGELSHGCALASVFPVSAEEVEFLAKVAERFSLPLIPLGAGTAPEVYITPEVLGKEGSVLIRFYLMRGMRLPDSDEPWAEAEPGVPWLALDNNLSARGQGLTVYPTSAPSATVGGWIARDGIGIGSFEYGRMWETVVSADVVLPGGERRRVGGEELGSVVGPDSGGIVVGAILRTRNAANDMPFALAFDDREDLASAVARILDASVPLWHLSFVNTVMAEARGLGSRHLVFGAYPGERAPAIDDLLQEVAGSGRGDMIPSTEAYRIWSERFFPIAPSRPAPKLTDRTIIAIGEIAASLANREDKAVQGTVARSGESLLIAFDARQEGWIH